MAPRAIAVHALYNAASVALTWAVGADIATVVTVGPDRMSPSWRAPPP